MPSPVWIDRFEPLELFPFIFRLENLFILLIFSPISAFQVGAARNVGAISMLYSIMPIYLTTLLFVGYLFVTLEFTARGFQTPPVISANMMASEKARIFKLVLIISLFISIYLTIPDANLRFLWLVVSFVLLPAITSLLIIGDSFQSAMHPLNWLRLITNLRRDRRVFTYLALSIVAIVFSYLAFFEALGWLNLLTMFTFQSCCLLLFRCLGIILHTNADLLGIPVTYGPQVEARQREALASEETLLLSQKLYNEANAGRLESAFKQLQERLQKDRYQTEPAIFGRLKKWENPALAVRAGQGFIERLVARGEVSEALEVLLFCFSANGNDYQVTNPETLLTLADQAQSIRQKAVVGDILQYFEKDFPNHPRTDVALMLAAQNIADAGGDFNRARSILQRIRIKYPGLQADERFVTLVNLLKQNRQPGKGHSEQ